MAPIHGKNVQVFGGNLLQGLDLSPWLNKVSAEGIAAADETSTFGDNAKTYMTGLLEAKVSMEGIHEFIPGGALEIDPAFMTTGSPFFGNDASTAAGQTVFVVLPAGGNGTVADRVYALAGIVTSFGIDAPVAGVVTVKAEQVGNARLDLGSVQFPLASRSSAGATNGTGIDDGAGVSAISNAVSLFYACTAHDLTGAVTVKLQSSSDNVTFADIAGATLSFSTTSAQRVRVAGSFNRYIRAVISSGGHVNTTVVGSARHYT